MLDAPAALLAELRFDAQSLVRAHPPRVVHPNKAALWALSSPPGATHAGELWVTRWAGHRTPASPGPLATPTIALVPTMFDYGAPSEGTEAWWVNFADPMLFGFYGGGLFAQDEMQVAEHPALASLREALLGTKLPPRTMEGRDTPTPVLVMGVERRCAVDTTPDAAAGRPFGLYGNLFARASRDVVQRATRVLDPPTRSNILAIAAPPPSNGPYTLSQIRAIHHTAFTGFSAARWCGQRRWMDALRTGRVRTEIHTGYWGCGAFGGNRVLTSALPLLAARDAGVDAVIFHTVNEAGLADAEAAVRLADATRGAGDERFEWLAAQGFVWGVSDGN